MLRKKPLNFSIELSTRINPFKFKIVYKFYQNYPILFQFYSYVKFYNYYTYFILFITRNIV